MGDNWPFNEMAGWLAAGGTDPQGHAGQTARPLAELLGDTAQVEHLWDAVDALAALRDGGRAGGGVCHTERSHPDDRPTSRPMHGLQTWVALPDDAQETAPSFEHVAAADVPTDTSQPSGVPKRARKRRTSPATSDPCAPS